MKWSFVAIIACIANSGIAETSCCQAQDTLIIRTADGMKTKRTGKILSWHGEAIVILTGSRERVVESSDVVELQTTWPAALKQARERVAEKNYPIAIRDFQKARSGESRRWVKSIIDAEFIQALDAVEKPTAAAALFLEIYQEDPETRFFDLIPLAWSIGELQAPADDQIERWSNSDNPVAQLLGASWLISKNGSKASLILEQLANHPDNRIAQLATAQLWRRQSLTADESDIARWSKQINRIDIELRAGPLVVLAMAQKKVNLNDRANINFLKVPILYNQKKSLSAFALYQSGSILNDADPTREKALALYRELIRNYPNSQYAEFARGKL